MSQKLSQSLRNLLRAGNRIIEDNGGRLINFSSQSLRNLLRAGNEYGEIAFLIRLSSQSLRNLLRAGNEEERMIVTAMVVESQSLRNLLRAGNNAKT